MLRYLVAWLVTLAAVRGAFRFPSDAVNGLWTTTGIANEGIPEYTRLKFNLQPPTQTKRSSSNDQDKRDMSSDWLTWRWTPATSPSHNYDNFMRRSSSTPKAAWPWRRIDSTMEQGDPEGKETYPIDSRDSAADASGSAQTTGCGKSSIDPTEVIYAANQIAAYCEQVGIVGAYQHIAVKWGSTVAYICARGHPETCSANDFIAAMQYIQENCVRESGWVFNNYLDPEGPANKYGVDIDGSNFC